MRRCFRVSLIIFTLLLLLLLQVRVYNSNVSLLLFTFTIQFQRQFCLRSRYNSIVSLLLFTFTIRLQGTFRLQGLFGFEYVYRDHHRLRLRGPFRWYAFTGTRSVLTTLIYDNSNTAITCTDAIDLFTESVLELLDMVLSATFTIRLQLWLDQ